MRTVLSKEQITQRGTTLGTNLASKALEVLGDEVEADLPHVIIIHHIIIMSSSYHHHVII